MANLHCDFFQSGGYDRERGKKFRVTVALDHLRSHLRGLKAEPAADRLFHFDSQMRGIAHRSRDLAHGHLPRGVAEALLIAPIFGKPIGNLEAEGNRLGMNAMGAPDLGSMLKLVRPLFEHFAQALESRVYQA